MRLCQDLLQHQGIDIHHAILEQMQGEHADFVIFAAIADHFAATGEEDKIVGAVPLLDNIEAPVDLAAEAGANIKLANQSGFTPLHHAGEAGSKEVAVLLIAKRG